MDITPIHPVPYSHSGCAGTPHQEQMISYPSASTVARAATSPASAPCTEQPKKRKTHHELSAAPRKALMNVMNVRTNDVSHQVGSMMDEDDDLFSPS